MTVPNSQENDDLFVEKIAQKERRKLKAFRDKDNGVWMGLGMMGMVGWSVAVPSLLGTGLGIWLDKKYPKSFSWTLSFLIAGLLTGSVIAWYWVAKENKQIHGNKEDEHE